MDYTIYETIINVEAFSTYFNKIIVITFVIGVIFTNMYQYLTYSCIMFYCIITLDKHYLHRYDKKMVYTRKS